MTINTIRLIVAYLIPLFSCLYLHSNINSPGGSEGTVWLLLSLMSFVFLVLLHRALPRLGRLSSVDISLCTFLIYFMFNYYFDVMDWASFRQVTIGSTGGIVFGLVLGAINSYGLSVVYHQSISRASNLAGNLGIAFMAFCALLAYLGFQEHYSHVRTDLFLSLNATSGYQRTGSFVFMQFIILCSVAAVLISTCGKGGVRRATIFLLLVLTAIVYSVTSQLIGSNSGLVATVGFAGMFFLFVFIQSGVSRNFSDLHLVSMILGKIGRRAFVGGFLVLMALVFLSGYLFFFSGIDQYSLRIFGYGEAKITSIDSRLALFQNFYVQFSLNPLFGNAQADVLTTGAGTYIHSVVVSIMTHLGVVGLLLFLGLNFSIYRQISRSRNRNFEFRHLYNDKKYGLFRLIALATVLLFGTLTAFYTWLPYWFSVGIFGVVLVKPRACVLRYPDNHISPASPIVR